MKHKFKVGDKVRVKKLDHHKSPFIESMKKFEGRDLVITKYSTATGNYRVGDYWYNPESLEPGDAGPCVPENTEGDPIEESIEKENEVEAAYSPSDAVNSPPHYIHKLPNGGTIETIEYMRAISTTDEFVAHCRLSAIGYLSRMGKKDDVKQEIGKAIKFLEFAKEALEDERK